MTLVRTIETLRSLREASARARADGAPADARRQRRWNRKMKEIRAIMAR